MYQNLIFLSAFLIWTVDSQIRNNPNINTYPCSPPGPTPSLQAFTNYCYDTPGCKVPDCCGVISGKPTIVSVTYRAIKNVTGGSVTVPTKVALSTPDPLNLFLMPPLQLTVPPPIFYQLFDLNPDMCYDGPDNPLNSNFCPQTVGNIYTYNCRGNVQLSIIDTATVILNMDIRLTSEGETIFCTAARVRGISPNLLNLLGPTLYENVLAG